eukprot:COSAG06_NODE_477_length_15216_cov_133.572402_10_plen_104_part_00
MLRSTFDWITTAFASTIVGFAIAGEMKDIKLVSSALNQAKDGEAISSIGHLVMTVITGLRRWAFLPLLALSVPMLITLEGGDALSICLNTVAILFVCEFAFGV